MSTNNSTPVQTNNSTPVPTQTDRFVCYFDVQNCSPLLQEGTCEAIASAFATALATVAQLPQPYTGDVEVFHAKTAS
jgi:hypothetical protein